MLLSASLLAPKRFVSRELSPLCYAASVGYAAQCLQLIFKENETLTCPWCFCAEGRSHERQEEEIGGIP